MQLSKSNVLTLPGLLLFGFSLACSHAAEEGDATQASTLAAHEGENTATRQRGEKRLERLFSRYDQDGDGRILLTELPEEKREHLSEADLDGDGALTREEMKQAHQRRRQEFQTQADKDGDGQVSEAEGKAFFEVKMQERFARKDANHDGALSADEVSPRHWTRIQKADGNNDARISFEELRTHFEQHHARAPHHGARGHGGPQEH